MPADLPLPPLEMRELIGQTDLAYFDNPSGEPIFDGLPPEVWRSYLDFGCGCGRNARRLMQQRLVPERYVGIDLHRGMIQWCQTNLTPHAPQFQFFHHDVYNPGLNPDATRPWADVLPADDGSVTLVSAHSVFTHLIESQAEFYLDEVARVLAPDAVFAATFFLFDKRDFPFMQRSQNALYINDRDPTNAVVYDRAWLLGGLADRGLALVAAQPPGIRGFHWDLRMAPARPGVHSIELPDDTSERGHQPPPLLRENAARIGLDGSELAEDKVEESRQELWPPNPAAAELVGAKRYIASLEEQLRATQRDVEALRQERQAGSGRRWRIPRPFKAL